MQEPTYADVDLSAICHNVREIKRLVGDRKILVPVKADAYGHGAVPIAKRLADEKLVDWLGVATSLEALQLREAKIQLPILRLSQCFDEDLTDLLRMRITPTVVDERTILAVAECARQLNLNAYPVHLVIDTGMRRVGCDPAQAGRLAQLVVDSGLDLEGIFTHLPISDCDAGKDFTVEQVKRFMATVADINRQRNKQDLSDIPLVHIGNSGGILNHNLGASTMVRPGILTYGYYPHEQSSQPLDLRHALTWRTKVGFIKTMKAGETVSYGRTWTAPQDCWVATVPIGYADGYLRLNSNSGRMLINGKSFAVAGVVTMDQTMLNLGPADQPCPAAVGDDVIICGEQGDEVITLDEMAECCQTISYEICCAISKRVPRRYFG